MKRGTKGLQNILNRSFIQNTGEFSHMSRTLRKYLAIFLDESGRPFLFIW
jgi:hypothetical protein